MNAKLALTNWVERVRAERRGHRPLALLFDYDGTLTPLVSHPQNAVLPLATREVLAGLAAAEGVQIGIVSGRPLEWIRATIDLEDAWYAGSNGMHIDLGTEQRLDPTIREFETLADSLIVALSEPIHSFPGTWLERKPGCLTLHYRSLLPLMAACFLDEVKSTLDEIRADCPPLLVRSVSSAIEIALADAWTKGNAIEWMLDRGDPNALVVFACDGANDEEAVRVVNNRGGITVGVGPDCPKEVAFRAVSPGDLATHLDQLASAIQAGHPLAGIL